MKILAIPDLHGNTDFLIKIIELGFENFDKVIFLGDYLDPRDENYHSVESSLDFANKINGLVKTWGDKIDFLIGNHEFGYIPSSFGGNLFCRFGTPYFREIYGDGSPYGYEKLEVYDKLKFFVQYDNILFSHAGVRIGLLQLVKENSGKTVFSAWKDCGKPNYYNLLATDDEELKAKRLELLHFCEVSSYRGGNLLARGGVAWIDYEAEFLPIEANEPEGLFQIFGHTKKGGITRSSFGSLCLDSGQKAYAIVDTEQKLITVHTENHKFYNEPELPFKIQIKNF